jgi:hypothetical protein
MMVWVAVAVALAGHVAVATGAPNRTDLAWMGWGGRTDAEMDTITRYFINNRDAFTTASPTSHTLGENGTLVVRNLSATSTYTPASVFGALRAGGVRVLPTIYNDASGEHTELLPKFLKLAASPGHFISQARFHSVSFRPPPPRAQLPFQCTHVRCVRARVRIGASVGEGE